MTGAPFLAELSDSNPETGCSECLSVFLAEGETAAECLTDPRVVSERPAPGHWRLIGVDEGRRRAYYGRIEHARRSACGARAVARGTYIFPPIS